MNYLAHLYLSGNDEQIMVGNFIGDHVKGNDIYKFPDKIRKGILIHRQIDTFTDSHHKFREARVLFRPGLGLYSGIVVDFVYDHFLARNWNEYSDLTLRTYAKWAHAVLLQNFTRLPARIQGFLPFLIQNRRFESYASVAGIEEAMKIMSNYSSLPPKTDFVIQTLQENYSFFDDNFRVFMHDMIDYIIENNGIVINRQNFQRTTK